MRKNYLWYNFWRYIITKWGLFFFYKNIKIGQRESAKRKTDSNYPKSSKCTDRCIIN